MKRVGDLALSFGMIARLLGDVPFRTLFSHLFDLANNKMSTVAEMCGLGWEVGGETWSWRRRLWRGRRSW